MKKLLSDAQTIERLRTQQRGVFSKSDLQTALNEKHPASFVRRVTRLVTHHVLQRFTRGWYVTKAFDLATLSQRIAPDSYLSFGTVLAKSLLVGPSPERHITAAKLGKSRTYTHRGYDIVHLGISANYFFGFDTEKGIQVANPEKAVLDVFYFYLWGRRYPFDIYSDIQFDKLDENKFRTYLARYKNPKFVSFATKIFEAQQ